MAKNAAKIAALHWRWRVHGIRRDHQPPVAVRPKMLYADGIAGPYKNPVDNQGIAAINTSAANKASK